MPITFLYLAIMIVVIMIWFVLLKRPVYEALLVAFAVLLLITGTWRNIFSYIHKGMKTTLLYSMAAFIVMSVILQETGILDSCIAIILSLLGRIPGGAGYVSVVGSAFMGALSGSGPGNVMTTGIFTIPAMKKSGFPPELAANIECCASYMGNMIPPSSNIVAAFGAFCALYPDTEISMGNFWLIMWGVSVWFILQRLIMVYGFCKYYKVEPMKKEELPQLKTVFRQGWKGLLLPVIILLPFVLDTMFNASLITQRLGADGAKFFSQSILIFIPGLVVFYSYLTHQKREALKTANLAKDIGRQVSSIVPPVSACLFGYMIGAMFNDLSVTEEMSTFIVSLSFTKLEMVLFVAVLTCILGMVFPGSSIVVTFGPVFIAVLVSAGVEPVLAAAMLPCICGVMCGMTPPLGLGIYAGMSLAESEFGKTVKNILWWVAAQFFLEVAVLMGWLPIIGL